jgi:hypothetical protein
MIEIKEQESGISSYDVVIDGHIVRFKWLRHFLNPRLGITTDNSTNTPLSTLYSIYIQDEDSLDRLLAHLVSEIPGN